MKTKLQQNFQGYKMDTLSVSRYASIPNLVQLLNSPSQIVDIDIQEINYTRTVTLEEYYHIFYLLSIFSESLISILFVLVQIIID